MGTHTWQLWHQKIMEEPQNRPALGDDRSEKTAETLRNLRNLADQTLGKHRRRLSTIESTLNTQLQQIAEELACDQSDSEIETAAFQQQHEELEHCRKNLAEVEEEIAALRGQLAARTNEQNFTEAESAEHLGQLQQQYEQEKQEHQQLASEVHQLQEDLSAADEETETLREQLVTLSEEQETAIGAASEQYEQFRQLEEERNQLTAELQETKESLSSAQAEAQALRDLQSAELGEHEKQLAQQTIELANLKQKNQQSQEKNEQIAKDLEEAREKTSQANYDRDCLAEELQASKTNFEELQSLECEQCVAGQKQIAELEQRHVESETKQKEIEQQLAELEEKQGQTQQSLEVAEANNEKAASLLRETEQRLIDIAENTELEQTNRKFELALADAEKLKRENAELSEELARRPEANDHESPELVSLRSERDALASRVAVLESEPHSVGESDNGQEIADLQRRFELAVKDVRHLKQENADLHAQVETVASTPQSSECTDGLDWQAQKARLMAELDAEEGGNPIAPERTEARATIEGTISITDRVVAEKDREIADLQSQLGDLEQEAPTSEEVQQTAIEQLFDKDEMIQAERTRLEEVQHEWEGKLREAEIELSVQRATIAREQVLLDEKLAQLEATTADVEPCVDGKPRRRWLSALGLKDDDDA